MKIKTVLLIALIVHTISCKSEEKKTNEETRMERVISVHDEMMPKMGTIGKLIRALEQKADSTAGEPYKFAQDDLENAYTYMMDWMKGFGDRFDSDEIMNGKALSKQKEAWLIEEEEKVTIMRDMINNSITNAEALLKDKNED